MPITTECPLCSTKGQVPSSFNGKRVKCPKCCNLFLVTSTSSNTSGSCAGNQKIADLPGANKLASAQQGTVKPGSTHHGTVKPSGSTQQGIMPKPGSSHQGNHKPGSAPGNQKASGSAPGNRNGAGNNNVRRAMATQEMQLPPGKLDQMIARRQAGNALNGKPRKGQNPAPLVIGAIALLIGLSAAAVCWVPDVASFGMWLGLIGLGVGGLGILLCKVMKKSIGLSATGCVLCLIGVIGGFAFAPGSTDNDKKSADTKPTETSPAKETRPEPTKPEPPPPVVEEWVTVPAGVARAGAVQVRVTAAEIDSVKGKDGKPLHPTLQQLVIKVLVENGGNDKVNYRGAGDPGTKFGEGAPRLTDDQGKPYQVVSFGKDQPIAGQLEATVIAPKKSVTDLLVFERPADKTEYLKLELPGANFGGAGKLKLKIPRAFVKAPVAPPPPPEKDIKQLLVELKNANPQIRTTAAQRLGDAGAKAVNALPDLTGALKDGDPNFRAAVAEAIGKIGGDPRSTVPLLLGALKDPIPKVRASAAQALGHFGAAGEPAVAALIAAFTDPDEEVAVKAREALKRIKGAK
jgi:HEAT repeats/PBS lyase HEAT-like repeat